uniref:Uncharacterized protein n=1 Tax=Strongyloides venezuelensis TaxID=75913 RepID=A0A0K0FCL5_STRVS
MGSSMTTKQTILLTQIWNTIKKQKIKQIFFPKIIDDFSEMFDLFPTSFNSKTRMCIPFLNSNYHLKYGLWKDINFQVAYGMIIIFVDSIIINLQNPSFKNRDFTSMCLLFGRNMYTLFRSQTVDIKKLWLYIKNSNDIFERKSQKETVKLFLWEYFIDRITTVVMKFYNRISAADITSAPLYTIYESGYAFNCFPLEMQQKFINIINDEKKQCKKTTLLKFFSKFEINTATCEEPN